VGERVGASEVAPLTACVLRVACVWCALFTRYADWRKFLQGARQRTYKKGEYVLKEGQPTAALFQIVSGTLRVELQIKDKAQAVIVGYRQAGDMFGETSLLKSGVATASIAAESEAVVMCLEGSYLEELFQESPGLPGRFFCFIAAYEAERLYQLTKGAADSKKPKVTVSNSVRVSLDEIMANRAYSVPTAIRTEALATAERCAAADPACWYVGIALGRACCASTSRPSTPSRPPSKTTIPASRSAPSTSR
jgi:CRP-like cAMP-binding protein